MANFSNGYILTKAGAALMAEVEAGKLPLELTKLQLGSGTTSSIDNYLTSTALVNPQNSMVITSIDTEDAGEVRTCLLKATLTSEAVDSGYEATELGIFAQDSSGKEILYGVCYDENPGKIASKNDGNNVLMEFALRIITTSQAVVELILPQTAEELVALVQDKAVQTVEAARNAADSAENAADSNSYSQLAMSKANDYADKAEYWAKLAKKKYDDSSYGKVQEAEANIKEYENAARISELNAKQSEINAKNYMDEAAKSAASISGGVEWDSVKNKPAAYPAAEHSHDEKYPDLDGTRATGTWAIDISGSSASCSGNAATATSISDTKLTLSNGTQIWVE